MPELIDAVFNVLEKTSSNAIASAGLAPTVAKVWDHMVGPGYDDPRSQAWPLVADYRGPLAISFLYLFGIAITTFFMKRRAEPFQLKELSILHNFVLFALSAYMCTECILASYDNFGWGKNFKLWCNQLEKPGGQRRSFTPSGARLARILYIHYLSKAFEFVDTFIAIFKKNFRQVSFLHVYHHVTTFFPVWYWVIRYGPGGEAWFCCMLNSFIHVLMYGYYLLTSLSGKDSGLRKALGVFKPMITYMQMFQFLLFIAQGAVLISTDCFIPRIQPWMLLVQCVIFFVLFANFALRNYFLGGKGKGSQGAGRRKKAE